MNRNWQPVIVFLSAALLSLAIQTSATAVDKLVDKTLLPHDPSPEGVYRWSEGSIVNLDRNKHLMMLVTALGFGGHDDTAGDIVRLDSLDGGLTWTPQDKITVFQKNIGKANIQSPSLLRLDENEILCFFMVKHKALTDSGTWMKRSTDNGKTWSDPVRLPYEGYGGLSSDRAFLSSTGRIILPEWVSMDGLKSTHAYCHYSDDKGKTWKKTDLITVPKGTTGRRTDPASEEPTIVELKDGRLMMFMRVYLKSIYVSYSEDDGATWSKPVSSGIPGPGAMPTLRRMPDGNLLLVWNWAPVEKIDGPWPRNRISSVISKDDGKTWTSLRHLDDGGDDFPGKMTMANVAFCGGNAVVTYSKSQTKKNAYSWCLQVIPLQWFYEGDTSIVYGQPYVKALEAKIGKGKKAPAAPTPTKIPRPKPEARKAFLETHAKEAAEFQKNKLLVAAYSFDEGEGDFVYDLSAGGNDLAILRKDGKPLFADGKNGRAMAFDGTAGYLAAPNSKNLRFESGTCTLEAWVYPTANKQHNCIFSKDYAFQVALKDGKLQAAVFSPDDRWGGPGWYGDTTLPVRQWSHITVSYDGRRIGFQVNGKPAGIHSRGAKMSVNDNPITVGNITHVTDGVFAGKIDDLRVYDTVIDKKIVDDSFPDQPVRTVGTNHELFIDDQLIARMTGLERIVNQATKCDDNPVLTWTEPWEGNCTITWGSVLYDPDDQRFKIWYEVYKKFPPKGESGMLICYAVSKDGFTWEKPELGIHEFRGSKKNNIVFRDRLDSPSVFFNPKPTKDARFLMFWYDCNERGVCSAASPDGVHWKRQEGVRVKSGDRTTAGYDPLRKKFYVITRIRDRGVRTCGLWESEDGLKFEFVKEIAAADKDDPPETQFYGMIRFPYEGVHLGFLEPFFIPLRKLDTQLMYSRDGLDWHRACDRQTFLPWGPPGSWDQAWVIPSHNAPIRVGDKLYIFYQGRQTLHWAEAPFGHIGSVGLAFLRPDGFVSLETQWNVGSVVTAPLRPAGKTLHINAKAKPGSVWVEVLDKDGKVIDGFSKNACAAMQMTDSLDHVVTWKDYKTLDKFEDKTIRLKFYVQGAKLYSFWTE